MFAATAAAATLLTLSPVPQTEPPSHSANDGPVIVYVGPAIKNGFAVTDRGIDESVADLRRELRKSLRCDESGFCKGDVYRLVGVHKGATVRLYVRERFVGFSSTGYSGSVTTSGTTTTGHVGESITSWNSLTVDLEAGQFKRTYSEGVGRWSKLANRVAKDVTIWLEANRQQLSTSDR